MTIPTTKEKLDEALHALHQLNIGNSVVSIQKDGRRVEFRPADRAQLQAYISQLQAEVTGSGPRRRAFRVRA